MKLISCLLPQISPNHNIDWLRDPDRSAIRLSKWSDASKNLDARRQMNS